MKGNDPNKKSVHDFRLPNPVKAVEKTKPEKKKKKKKKKDGDDDSPHTPHFQLPIAQNPQ